MHIKWPQVAQHLKQGLHPLYLVHGGEPLLMRDTCDSIRHAATAAGYTDRRVFNSDTDGWGTLLEYRDAQSLFAALTLLDIRLWGKGPGRTGGKVLTELANTPPADTLSIVNAGATTRAIEESKWFKALAAKAVQIHIWPIRGQQELMSWAQNHAKSLGISLDREAWQPLLLRTEGNLLATAQELQKLSLLNPDGQIGVEQVRKAVADNSHYDAFESFYAALQGDAARAVHALQSLAAAGALPVAIIGTWTYALQMLQALQHEQAHAPSASFFDLLKKSGYKRPPKPNQAIIQQALSQVHPEQLAQMMELVALADAQTKGAAIGDPWHTLADFCLLTASKPPVWLQARLQSGVRGSTWQPLAGAL